MELYSVGYLYIMDLISTRKVEHIKVIWAPKWMCGSTARWYRLSKIGCPLFLPIVVVLSRR